MLFLIFQVISRRVIIFLQTIIFVHFEIRFFWPNRKMPTHQHEEENMLTTEDPIRRIDGI